MRPVSQRFLNAVAASHRMDARARVVPAGLSGTSPGTILATLDIVGGAVTLDAKADVRSTLDMDTSAVLWPTSATGPLTPYGNELFIERGVVYGDGTREWVSQGYFRINTVEQQTAPKGVVHVTGTDRTQGIIDARLTTPWTFAAGSTVASVIQALVTDVYPWAVYDFDSTLSTSTLASSQTTTDDRYGFISDLVKSYGMVMYWDYRGFLWIHKAPSTTTSLAAISSGAHGTLVTVSRSLARDGIYNACVASGQQMSESIPQVLVTVVDNNPTSPTYWSGSFGKVPQFYSSSFITTTDQATSAATSLLLQSTGLPYSVSFGHVPNPALEPLDPITVNYPGRSERHVLSQLVIPLGPGSAQTGQTRQLVTGTNFS